MTILVRRVRRTSRRIPLRSPQLQHPSPLRLLRNLLLPHLPPRHPLHPLRRPLKAQPLHRTFPPSTRNPRSPLQTLHPKPPTRLQCPSHLSRHPHVRSLRRRAIKTLVRNKWMGYPLPSTPLHPHYPQPIQLGPSRRITPIHPARQFRLRPHPRNREFRLCPRARKNTLHARNPHSLPPRPSRLQSMRYRPREITRRWLSRRDSHYLSSRNGIGYLHACSSTGEKWGKYRRHHSTCCSE